MIYQLDPKIIGFPDPREGEEDGIFAVGGDLCFERLLLAYENGIFPWYAYRKEDNRFLNPDGEPWIQWWCPMKRFVIFPKEIHVSHSMRTLMNKGKYTFSFNMAFDKVIRYCGSLRENHPGAWLGPHIIEVYTDLHKKGFATSVEVWDMPQPEEVEEPEKWYFNDRGLRLVGGLYGVNIGKSFIGESMFSLVPSGSKLALIFLAKWMEEQGLNMIDCQLYTEHLASMGGRYISYDEYMKILNNY